MVPIELLSIDQVAEILGVSRATVFREMRRGRIPFRRIGGRRRVLPTEIMNYARAS